PPRPPTASPPPRARPRPGPGRPRLRPGRGRRSPRPPPRHAPRPPRLTREPAVLFPGTRKEDSRTGREKSGPPRTERVDSLEEGSGGALGPGLAAGEAAAVLEPSALDRAVL